MLFSKAIGALLALASVVASQVIVTVTNTVTIVTVTVTPLSTSTYTTYVTVGGNPPPDSTQLTTIYFTTTATSTLSSSASVVTTCPIPLYDQCGGVNWNGCQQCVGGAACKSQNAFYWQCIANTGGSVVTVTQTIYRG